MEKLNETSKGIEVIDDRGGVYEDTFYVIDKATYNGKDLYLLESENYGEDVPGIIVDEDRNVILEDVVNGFDDYLERREDLLNRYDLKETILLYDNNNNPMELNGYYIMPHQLEFIDNEDTSYEVYLEKNKGDIVLKTKEGKYIYSEKFSNAYKNEEIILTDSWNIKEYQFDELTNAVDKREDRISRPHGEDENKDTSSEEKELTEDEQKRKAILQGVGAVMNSEGFANYAKTINNLMYNKFSPRNCNLIMNQYIMKYCSNNNINILDQSEEQMKNIINQALESENVPSYLMGYEAWKEYGRQVTGKNIAYTIVVPNYVTEYNGKGTIIRAMEKKFNEEFSKNNNRDYSEFKLGNTGLVFRSYGNKGNKLIDICIGDKILIGKQGIEDVRKFLNNEVIGKMVNSYSYAYVYDVKNTIIPEHLWVKTNYKKTELITDEKGEPVTRNPYKNSNVMEYKINNTEERISKFNPDLSMDVTGLTEEKSKILFDVLREVSTKKGVPVTMESLKDGSRGYYHIGENRIAISNNLNMINKCATMIHEMAHADMHNVASLKSRNAKEVEAEAVSYMTAQRFGINTDVKSFNYLASWSRGRDLKELESSMNVILKESRKLESEISKELSDRGYTISLEKIDGEIELKPEETLKSQNDEYIKSYKEFVLNESTDIADLKNSAEQLLKETTDERCINIVKEQISILNKQNRKIVTIDKNLNQLENATVPADIKKITERIDKHFNNYNEMKKDFTELSCEFVNRMQDVKLMEKSTMKDKYNANPLETMKEYIKNSSNKELEKLTDKDLKYISSSEYLNSNYSKYISNDMEKFMLKGKERVEAINNIKSKNGQFVEIVNCEQWFENPILKNGALLHPVTANKIIKEAEKDIRQLKDAAKENGDYIPYSKCKFLLYTESKDSLLVTKSNIDIGDGFQSDLTSFLEKECGNTEVMEIYSKSIKERVKNKIYEPEEKKDYKEENKNDSRPHREDEKNKTLSSSSLRNFVSSVNTKNNSNNIEQEKQKILDRSINR